MILFVIEMFYLTKECTSHTSPLQVVDSLKGSVMKASGTSDSEESTLSRGGMGGEEQQVEVCRALYRLHFQVSLMYDTFAKLLLLLLHSSRHAAQV